MMKNNMCGVLFTAKTTPSSTDHIKTMFKNQSERGEDGFGAILVNDNRIEKVFRHTSDKIFDKLHETKASMVLFHHRFPTSTPNVVESTHPIKIQLPNSNHRYYVIHNGVISNDEQMYEKHTQMGLTYHTKMDSRTLYTTVTGKEYFVDNDTSYNDSEALAYELGLVWEGRQTKIEARGSIAFIALKTDLKNNVLAVLFGRNTDNPLYLRHTKKSIALASTNSAISTGVAPDSIEMVEANMLYTLDVRDLTISKAPFDFGGYGAKQSTYYGSTYISNKDYDLSKWSRDDKYEVDDYKLDIDKEKQSVYEELFDYFDEGYDADAVKRDLIADRDALDSKLSTDYDNNKLWAEWALITELIENTESAYTLYCSYLNSDDRVQALLAKNN